MTQRNLRWGILGTGRAARDFARGLRFVPRAEARAVASRSAERGEAFARRAGVARVYAGYEALLGSGEVDAVYVATPAHRHREDCLSSLRAGVPILCEKPFAIDAGEAREVVDAARAAGVFCMEAMWMRCIPLVQRAREIARSGEIGEVRRVTADFGMADAPSARTFSRELGGGALLERGVYGVSLAHWLLGEPESVWARAEVGASGVDERTTAVLAHPGGAESIVTASLRERSGNEAWIVGTCGRVRIHEFFFRPERLTLDRFPEPTDAGDGDVRRDGLRARLGESRLLRGARLRAERLLPRLGAAGSREIVEAIDGNGYNYEAAEVARCLGAGRVESPLMPWSDTLAVMQTLDAIRAQCELRSSAGAP